MITLYIYYLFIVIFYYYYLNRSLGCAFFNDVILVKDFT